MSEGGVLAVVVGVFEEELLGLAFGVAKSACDERIIIINSISKHTIIPTILLTILHRLAAQRQLLHPLHHFLTHLLLPSILFPMIKQLLRPEQVGVLRVVEHKVVLRGLDGVLVRELV